MFSPITNLVVALSAQAISAEPIEPKYATQNLMIFNDKGELLLQRNFMG